MKESGGGAITFITTTASVETFGGPPLLLSPRRLP